MTEQAVSQLFASARAQTKAYTEGPLAGFELTDYRYIVVVSWEDVEAPADVTEDRIVYRHIKLPVRPSRHRNVGGATAECGMALSTEDSSHPSGRSRDNFVVSAENTRFSRWLAVSNPDCRAPTTGPVSDPARASVVGVAAHITAAASGGPRFDCALSAQERKSVSNGIWLCATCAKKIDEDCSRYTSSVLRFWRLDAEHHADQEKGRPVAAKLRFVVIGLDPDCLWRPSHRLGKVAAQVGAIPQVGFHAIPQDAWSTLGVSPNTHSCDPILDITLVNDSRKLSVLSIGFEAHSVWSDLKGLPQPYKIRLTGGYVLTCGAITVGVPQMIQLPDPIAVPAGQPVRIKLTLSEFRAHLCGNESLLRLLVIADGDILRSRMINMGVY